jgi:hypothetical protein
MTEDGGSSPAARHITCRCCFLEIARNSNYNLHQEEIQQNNE